MEKLTKAKAQEIMKTPGEARGVGLKSDWEYIKQTKGEKGLRKLEAKMTSLGYPVKYEEIKTMDFYPIGQDIISMLSIKEVFNFSDKDMEKLGSNAPKFSILLKTFMKYFASIAMVLKEAPKTWRAHYTIGDIESEFDGENKQAILRLKNFKTHPIHCSVLKGYFSKILEMVTGFPVKTIESKCLYNGDKYHEWVIKW